MFRFWGSQEQQSQDGSSQSWYPPSVMSSSNSSRPATPTSSSSSPRPSSHVPPAEAAGVIAVLKDKSVDELRKLLADKDAYQQFLHSLDQVKIQTNVPGPGSVHIQPREMPLFK
ncbi:vacuolar protein-sorting-associated protein 37-like protein 1 [Sesbania bispinosa]|nr:vacuolar protein-sorting-associated protein 37-like protein 1 [Sesbania bispinosa]